MFVYSLTGRSGTGKSYQAMNVCRDLGIDAIIDDGLFIYKNKVEAGHSAKREETKVGAIKAAVFTREEHRSQVASRIKKCNPSKILVLGTSDEMADKICKQLELPTVSKYIHIEDITTESEREAARKSRDGQGKHVIPVPSMQLKRDFAGYFMNSLRLFWDRNNGHEQEKTVVRPTYSYLGNFIISESVIYDIARCVARECDGVDSLLKIYDNHSTEELNLTCSIAVVKGPGIWDKAEHFQRRLKEMLELMTAFNVVKVDVQIRRAV